MKITEVVCQILRIPNIQAKTASSQDAVLVRVRTDTGLEGVGEADSSPEVSSRRIAVNRISPVPRRWLCSAVRSLAIASRLTSRM